MQEKYFLWFLYCLWIYILETFSGTVSLSTDAECESVVDTLSTSETNVRSEHFGVFRSLKPDDWIYLKQLKYKTTRSQLHEGSVPLYQCLRMVMQSDCLFTLHYCCLSTMLERPSLQDLLWESCNTVICGRRPLNIQCEKSSYILINKVSSRRGQEFDQRSYINLRRICLGLTMCEPSRWGFCNTHSNEEFNVQYVCIRDIDVENECIPRGKFLSNTTGFITSPNYPAETRFTTCKWRINVPSGHYAHIFLHEVLPIMSPDLCHGLLFSAKSTCGKFFPRYPICDESTVTSLISACSDTDIVMSANSTHLMRFWLSYYVVPVSDLSELVLYDRDIRCEANKITALVYRPKQLLPASTVNVSTEQTTVSNLTEVVRESRGGEDEDNSAIYIGIGVAVAVVLILIIIVAVMYLRRRRRQKPIMAISSSTSNSTDIQKRPLPEFHTSEEDTSNDPVLQDGYSSVADELPPTKQPVSPTYSTYAEIEEYSEGGLKPQPKVINRRSIGSAVRELPKTPDEEPYSSTYSEIDDNETPRKAKLNNSYKDFRTTQPASEESTKSKNDTSYNGYNKGKKLSNASNIYAECADVINDEEKKDVDKTYVDMSHKPQPANRSANKGLKDKFNISKRSQGVTSVSKAENNDTKRGSGTRKMTPSWKKESVTSAESDSDDDLCIVENELYEPFESAKV